MLKLEDEYETDVNRNSVRSEGAESPESKVVVDYSELGS